MARIEARLAGNGASLIESRNAKPGPPWGSEIVNLYETGH